MITKSVGIFTTSEAELLCRALHFIRVTERTEGTQRILSEILRTLRSSFALFALKEIIAHRRNIAHPRSRKPNYRINKLSYYLITSRFPLK